MSGSKNKLEGRRDISAPSIADDVRHHRGMAWLVVPTVVLGGLACSRPAPSLASPSPTAAPDAAERADEAALYALPLVIMDLTRQQFFADPVTADATPNRFLHVPILANPSFRSVVRPNVDTLYSAAWLDVSADPVLMTLPPSNGRYFLVQCMDAWTNVFAAPGIRTLGDKGATYAIVGPGWQGQLPPEIEVLHAPTPMVWVLGRVYVRDQADLPAARAFQRQLDLRPSSRLNDASYQAVYPRPPAANAKRRIMRDILHDMSPEAFFERFASLTAANPPSPQDAPFLRDVLAPLGLSPGKPLTWARLDDANRGALAGGLERVLRALDKGVARQQSPVTPTGWSSMAAKLAQGNYGVNYRVRAAVAAIGLGANLRADAIYMNASIDGNQQPLDGRRRYRLTFAAGMAPPVHAFWSVTLYDDQGYLIANPLERHAIKSGDALVHEPDGSLVLYLQPDDPGPDHRANWLPTPADQRFELSLRAYWPGDELLDGRWTPPAVLPAG
jgi:hypothetical protein